jgi:hypothetical protein
MTCQRNVTRLVALSCSLLLAACSAAGHTSSPWEWGGGVRIAPGLTTLGESDVTVHPMASYTYLSFDGGHDSLWEFGGQVRKPFGAGELPMWFGGEAAFSHLRTIVDFGGSSFTGTTNGYSFTAMLGKQVSNSRWGPNIYAGAGISDYGSQGWNIRVGLDLQPTFLWR